MSDSDDEVDILGELPSPPIHNAPLSSYSELLKCDYTIHPQWLLDSTTTACWYDNPQPDEMLTETEMPTDSDEEQRPSTSSHVAQWTGAEKKMLHKGMEIYGQDPHRLSVFIGSKSPAEVRLFIESEYGINLDAVEGPPAISHGYGEILADNEIPASIEEVITMVNTAEPTVPVNQYQFANKSAQNVQSNFSSDPVSIINEVCQKDVDSLLYGIPKKTTKSKDKYSSLEKYSGPSDYSDGKLYIDLDCDKLHSSKRNKKAKFNTTLMLSKSTNLSRLVGKQKSLKTVKQKVPRSKTMNILPPKNTSLMEIVTGSGQAVPLSEGEQVIKIEKCLNPETESDVEIDIDGDNEDLKPPKMESVDFPPSETNNTEIKEEIVEPKSPAKTPAMERKCTAYPDHLKSILTSPEPPSEELSIENDEISDLEKVLYPDFFEGKVSKTPERYALIRSHILGCWRQCRPQYLTKTAVRQGLKNGGDVNCIGRIHTILEQMGAINFGCDQTSYTRPLLDLLNPSSYQQPPMKMEIQAVDIVKNEMLRQRKKFKKFAVDGVGGYTITHTESGEFYEAISEPKQPRISKKKPVNLIYCKIYTDERPSPYFVQISLSALILMDVHSYSSRAEVMGLLGGHTLNDNIVMIEKYIPCNSLEDSGTHCDMCPVSQSAATESLSADGYETIGWHHSHPLFPPQPSAQDILSQADFQMAFSPRPFLAMIISPYWLPGRTSSQFRCFITKKEEGEASDYDVPYRLKTHLHCDINNQTDVKMLLTDINEIRIKNSASTGKFSINMNEICISSNITILDKCISSIKHHLTKCDMNIEPEIATSVVNGICDIFK